ncbi:hypothetical protein [Leuconostoc suionicum]|uniref:hypothetical protein n=1 Tax=Leuconostoc suionicum TaxID=1511761 RepID=UPI0032DEE886
MNFSLALLQTFDGNIQPSQINIAQLANLIEAYVSQYKYFYKTSLKECPEIIIEVTNANIPHLLGLSKNHHYGLPTYSANTIFEGLKNDWTLDNLIKGDQFWFAENQDKMVGVLLLYQIFHIQDCKVYSTKHIIHQELGNRYSRDNIYFIIFRLSDNRSYSVELSPIKNSENAYFPRSLKINDNVVESCEEISVQLIKQERIQTKKATIKKIGWKLDD